VERIARLCAVNFDERGVEGVLPWAKACPEVGPGGDWIALLRYRGKQAGES